MSNNKAISQAITEGINAIKRAPDLATANSVYEREQRRALHFYNAGLMSPGAFARADGRQVDAIIKWELAND